MAGVKCKYSNTIIVSQYDMQRETIETFFRKKNQHFISDPHVLGPDVTMDLHQLSLQVIFSYDFQDDF